MRILIACEYSGRVRDAFRDKGHDAWSCDILPTEGREEYNPYHYQQDVFEVINLGWDMMIAFPPCTYLTVAANRHLNNPGRMEEREKAYQFFMNLYNAPIERIALENPVGYMNTSFRKPDQIFHPYYFGDPHLKRTCLWLKNLPKLTYLSTPIKPEPLGYYKTGKKQGKPIYFASEGKYTGAARAHYRNQTFPTVAAAMANQWSNL
jgi:hypothetical protein